MAKAGADSSDGANMPELKGIITALVTCFNSDGGLDIEAMRRSVKFQLAQGAHGVCPLGGTGEPLSLTTDERSRVIDAVMQEAGGRLAVVVGCLSASQTEIVASARHAKSAGADAIMVIPPYSVMPKPRHIRQHFMDIAEQADMMPMVLFNTPGRAGVRLDADFIIELASDVPNLVGIKEATGDVVLATELVRRAPAHFAVLQGFDELILPTLAVGGRGAMVSLGCLAPRLLVELHDAAIAGNIARARELQASILPLCQVIYSEPNPVPLKAALAMVGRGAGATRPPLYAPAPETLDRLRSMINAARGPLGAAFALAHA